MRLMIATICGCGNRIHPAYQNSGRCEDCQALEWERYHVPGCQTLGQKCSGGAHDTLTDIEKAVYAGNKPPDSRSPRLPGSKSFIRHRETKQRRRDADDSIATIQNAIDRDHETAD